MSIVKVKTKVENQLYPAKLAYGPTASIPGPILEIQERAEVKLDEKPWVAWYASPMSVDMVTDVPFIGSNDRMSVTIISKNR